MLQLVYNVHTCNHATCPHFHYPLLDTIATFFFIMILIYTISKPINVSLIKYQCYDYSATTYNLIRIQIHM